MCSTLLKTIFRKCVIHHINMIYYVHSIDFYYIIIVRYNIAKYKMFKTKTVPISLVITSKT